MKRQLTITPEDPSQDLLNTLRQAVTTTLEQWPSAEDALIQVRDIADEQTLQQVRTDFQKDGELEFDDDAIISPNTEHQGFYIQGWQWVPSPDLEDDNAPQ